MDNFYLREFRELVAAVIACPEVFSDDLEVVSSSLFQLTQLMNASWRSSLTKKTARARRGAASITPLAACIMGPFYEVVKPLDPVTKDTNVRNLYLHTPISHLHDQVGDNRADVALVADDTLTGTSAALVASSTTTATAPRTLLFWRTSQDCSRPSLTLAPHALILPPLSSRKRSTCVSVGGAWVKRAAPTSTLFLQSAATTQSWSCKTAMTARTSCSTLLCASTWRTVGPAADRRTAVPLSERRRHSDGHCASSKP